MNDIYKHKQMTNKIINSFYTFNNEHHGILKVISPKGEIKICDNLGESGA